MEEEKEATQGDQGGQVEALVGEEAGVHIAAPGPAQAGSEPEYP